MTSKVLERELILVEFGGEFPHHVETLELQESWPAREPSWHHEIYDFDYNDRSGRMLACGSGSGPADLAQPHVYLEGQGHDYWKAERAYLRIAGSGRRLPELDDKMRKLIVDAIEHEVLEIVTCTICVDSFGMEVHGEDSRDDPCPHIWWCTQCYDWAGPGAGDGEQGCQHRAEAELEDELDEMDLDLECTHL